MGHSNSRESRKITKGRKHNGLGNVPLKCRCGITVPRFSFNTSIPKCHWVSNPKREVWLSSIRTEQAAPFSWRGRAMISTNLRSVGSVCVAGAREAQWKASWSLRFRPSSPSRCSNRSSVTFWASKGNSARSAPLKTILRKKPNRREILMGNYWDKSMILFKYLNTSPGKTKE